LPFLDSESFIDRYFSARLGEWENIPEMKKENAHPGPACVKIIPEIIVRLRHSKSCCLRRKNFDADTIRPTKPASFLSQVSRLKFPCA
jgi:hypothetical protein